MKLIIFAILMLGLATHAGVGLRAATLGSDEILIYAEEGGWIVERIAYAEGKLPQKTGRWYFGNSGDANAFVSKNFGDNLSLHSLVAGEPKFSTEVPGQYVWQAQNEWSQAWEVEYARWVRKNINADYFMEKKLATDCADVAVSVRWIFARIHSLPAANRLADGKVLFTNESMKKEWTKLATDPDWEKDQRFLAALNYVMNLTFTHSLNADSYPIRIARDSFTEGTHHLALSSLSGHTRLINEVNASKSDRLPVYAIASTVPRHIQKLSSYFFYINDQGVRASGGYLKIVWPRKINDVWSLTPATQMPDYSEEQYSKDFTGAEASFGIALLKRINPDFDVKLRVTEGIQYLKDQIITRQQVVEQGAEFCKRSDCSPGTANYEDWSTPSRDAHLKETFEDLEEFVQVYAHFYPEMYKAYQDAMATQTFPFVGDDYYLQHYSYIFRRGIASNDPRDPVADRWPLSPQAFTDLLIKRVDQFALARREKILDNKCLTTNCLPNTRIYQANATFEEDQAIRNQLTLLPGYCGGVSTIACENFRKLVESRKVKLPHEVSLNHAEAAALWLNSDPRWPESQRWGSLAQTRPHVFINGYVSTAASSDSEILFIVQGNIFNLYRLRDMAKIYSGSSGISRSFEKRSGRTAMATGKNLLLVDPIANLELSVPFDTKDSDVHLAWYSSSRLLAVLSDSILIFDFDGQTLKLEGQFPQTYIDFELLGDEKNQVSLFVHSKNEQGFSITDLSQPKLSSKYYKFSNPGWNSKSLTYIQGQRSRSLLVRYEGGESGGLSGSAILHLESGEVSPFSSNYTISMNELGDYLIYLNDGIYYSHFDENFIPVSKIRLDDQFYFGPTGSKYVQTFSRESRVSYWQIESTPIKFNYGTSEKLIFGYGELGLVAGNDKKMELRDFSGRTYLSAPVIQVASYMAETPTYYFTSMIGNSSCGLVGINSSEARPLITQNVCYPSWWTSTPSAKEQFVLINSDTGALILSLL